MMATAMQCCYIFSLKVHKQGQLISGSHDPMIYHGNLRVPHPNATPPPLLRECFSHHSPWVTYQLPKGTFFGGPGPQEISTLASEFQELQDAAGQWRRGCTVHLQMPMTTRQQEARGAVGDCGCWIYFWKWWLYVVVDIVWVNNIAYLEDHCNLQVVNASSWWCTCYKS